jgi:hypothetical protein
MARKTWVVDFKLPHMQYSTGGDSAEQFHGNRRIQTSRMGSYGARTLVGLICAMITVCMQAVNELHNSISYCLRAIEVCIHKQFRDMKAPVLAPIIYDE